MKIERLPKDAQYYFIQPSTLKPVLTRDLYFDSDDERFKSENYFLTRDAVNECAESLEPYADELERIASERKRATLNFVKGVHATPAKHKLSTEKATKDLAIFDLLELCQKHDDAEANALEAARLVRAKVENIIADAEKQ